MIEIYEEIKDLTDALNEEIRRFAGYGKDLSEANAKYKVRKSAEMLKCRDQKMPVTILSDIVSGYEEIASLRQDRDIKEAFYKASHEKIQAIKLQLRILQDQMNAVRMGQ